MTIAAFETLVQSAWSDEEKNRAGELSAVQMEALRACAGERIVDASLQIVRGLAMYTDGVSSVPFVRVAGRNLPLRPGLFLLSGVYDCFVTKEPAVVVGVSAAGVDPARLVAHYRRLLLEAQSLSEEDLRCHRNGSVSPRQQWRALRRTLIPLVWLLPGLGVAWLANGSQNHWESGSTVVAAVWSCIWLVYFAIALLAALSIRHTGMVENVALLLEKKEPASDKEQPSVVVWAGEHVMVQPAVWLLLVPSMPYRVYRIRRRHHDARRWLAGLLFGLKLDIM